ncbi:MULTISPECIES: hypothetical protein [Herbaspirillum]|uniref:hypothetical protein n=1 Tax=Herbaspirillum TaxID=963 RepID=UPI0011D2A486|nr:MULTISPECIES: hypothetical protein [Herbaspirillum]
MKSSDQNFDISLLALFFGVMWLLLMSPFLLTVFHPPHADICANDSGYTTANRSVQGVVHYLGRAVVIESGEGKSFRRTFLAGCDKHGCAPPYDKLKPITGKEITAGFCGHTLVVIRTSDGVDYYHGSPSPQAELDHKYSSDSLAIVIAYLLVLGLLVVCWRVIKRPS